jgi:hypothetical protein
MKITNRMKKILLFLLHPEKAFQWLNEKKISISKEDYYWDWQIMSFCTRREFWKFSRSEELSYRRTFKILRALGLIEGWERQMSWGVLEGSSYKLTDKGKKLAKRIEKDIREFIKDYEYLV